MQLKYYDGACDYTGNHVCFLLPSDSAVMPVTRTEEISSSSTSHSSTVIKNSSSSSYYKKTWSSEDEPPKEKVSPLLLTIRRPGAVKMSRPKKKWVLLFLLQEDLEMWRWAAQIKSKSFSTYFKKTWSSEDELPKEKVSPPLLTSRRSETVYRTLDIFLWSE